MPSRRALLALILITLLALVLWPPPAGAINAAGQDRAWFAGKSRAVVRALRYGASAVVEGRFSHRLGVGGSRVVEFSSGAASARATVRVRSGVTLRKSATRVRNGSALRFSGRVLGRQRALVTIYALGERARKRIPVETIRAGSDGRFSSTYRFARILGPAVYRFEARVPKQTGFPYLEGTSKRVTVHGRP